MKNGCEDEIPLNFSRRQSVGRPKKATAPAPLRILRIARLMALAIRFQDMVERGEVRDYAEIARLGYVTRARLTQIMNLMLLAPDIQEAILDNSSLGCASAIITEGDLRGVSLIIDWAAQRRKLDGIATRFNQS